MSEKVRTKDILRMAALIGSGVLLLLQHSKIRRLQKEARIDKPTGVLNKTTLESDLEKIAGQEGAANKVALIVADSTYFRRINNTFGHAAGDIHIRGIAQFLDGLFRRSGEEVAHWQTGELSLSGSVGRTGGDEFGMIVRLRAENEEEAEAELAHILEYVNANKDTYFSNLPEKIQALGFDLSIAGAVLKKGMTADELAQTADQKLYEVKELQHARGGATDPDSDPKFRYYEP